MKGKQLRAKGGIRQFIYPGMHVVPDLRTADATFNNSISTIMFHPKMEKTNLKFSFKHSKSRKQLALLILQIQQLAHYGTSRGQKILGKS